MEDEVQNEIHEDEKQNAINEGEVPEEVQHEEVQPEEEIIIDNQEPYIDKSVYEVKNKHKKGRKILLIAGGGILGTVILAYLVISVWFMFHFGNNTYIDGENVSFASLSSVKNEQTVYVNAYSLTVEMRNSEEYVILPEDIDLKIDAVTDTDEIKKLQNGFLWFLYIGNDKKDYTTKYEVTYDENLLDEFISNMNCLEASSMVKPENAYILITDGEAEIIPETEGTQLNADNLKKAISYAIENLEADIDLTDSDCYVAAAITSDSDAMTAEYEDLQKYLEMVITYEIDDVSWTLDAKTFGDWLYYDNGMWHFNTFSVKAYVEELAEKYDTVGTVRDFYTYSGKRIEQEGKLYGWKIDVSAETLELKDALKEGISQTKTPVFSQTGAAYNNFNDIGDTYVEVDLTNQKVYLIVDGKLILETACVSGCVTAGNGTPDGLYSITYKKSPAVLRGDDYESNVTYWMPFNGGIGLHDATWRSKFGGNIYYSSGSHGCINLPKSSAATIYSYVSAGTPVICYY